MYTWVIIGSQISHEMLLPYVEFEDNVVFIQADGDSGGRDVSLKVMDHDDGDDDGIPVNPSGCKPIPKLAKLTFADTKCSLPIPQYYINTNSFRDMHFASNCYIENSPLSTSLCC